MSSADVYQQGLGFKHKRLDGHAAKAAAPRTGGAKWSYRALVPLTASLAMCAVFSLTLAPRVHFPSLSAHTFDHPASGCQALNVSAVQSMCRRDPSYFKNNATAGVDLTRSCLSHLASSSSDYLYSVECERPPLRVHSFWVGGFTWQLKLFIESFITTHAGVSNPPILFLWLGKDLGDSLPNLAVKHNAPYLLCSHVIQFKKWDNSMWVHWLPPAVLGAELSQHSRKAALQRTLVSPTQSGNVAAWSDSVRFLILHRFGGLYLDADSIVLRDLSPLQHTEFVYEWSSMGYPNTAVMHLKQNSSVSAAIISGAVRATATWDAHGSVMFDQHRFDSFFWPQKVYEKLPAAISKSLVMLPCLLFDPVWLYPDGKVAEVHGMSSFDDGFAPVKPPLKIPTRSAAWRGAFVYHWHSQHHKPLLNDSIVGHLALEYSLLGSQFVCTSGKY
jgi:hypothetical protein